jgi:dephospho-CoA kinase
MLRVGLTGGLGSGKSTVAAMFAAHGAYVLSADEIGRGLMQPGEAVYAAIIARFGDSVVAANGSLDRPALARIAFGEGRIEELNAIVHPATIARQTELIEEIRARDPGAVVILESALIFETKHGGDGLLNRFDRIIVVTAPTELKVARFIERVAGRGVVSQEKRDALAADARHRLSQQIDDDQKVANSDYVLTNAGSVAELQAQVNALWPKLKAEAT